MYIKYFIFYLPNTNTFGSPIKAIANDSLLFIPPDNYLTLFKRKLSYYNKN
jgi:hypothetical protein